MGFESLSLRHRRVFKYKTYRPSETLYWVSTCRRFVPAERISPEHLVSKSVTGGLLRWGMKTFAIARFTTCALDNSLGTAARESGLELCPGERRSRSRVSGRDADAVKSARPPASAVRMPNAQQRTGPGVLSLPKGGGSLQSIGETFEPDLFTPPISLSYSAFRPHEQRYHAIEAHGGDLPPR